MSFALILFTGIFYLIPGTVEFVSHGFEAVGNMGMTGIYFDIKNKRNLLYFNTFNLICFSLGNADIPLFLPYGVFIFSTYLYLKTIYNWHPFIFY